MIAQLHQSLRALEKPAGIDGGPGPLPLGIAAIDAALAGGLTRGALHEIAAAGEAHAAAAAGFALGLSSSSCPALCQASTSSDRVTKQGVDGRDKPGHDGRGNCLVWIAEDMALAESGAPYGPGLDAFGLAPERLLTVAAAHQRDLLWAMEEALRCRAVAVVIGELRQGAIDPVAVRRLSLAAAQNGALALLLRAAPPHDASTAATRWIAGAAPHDRFAVRLTRNRRGPLGAWMLQWSDDDERFMLATHAQPVAAPAAERPHRKVA
jgi:protein ImuA